MPFLGETVGKGGRNKLIALKTPAEIS